MKHRLLHIIAAASCFLFFASCAQLVTGSGALVDQKLDFTDFTEVDCSQDFAVDIVPGDKYEVTVTCDDNAVQYLQCYKEGSRIHIGVNFGVNLIGATLRAKIRMPRLTAVTLRGSSKATIGDGLEKVPKLDFELSGESKLNGAPNAEEIALAMSGGSASLLKGAARKLTVVCSGGSTLDGTGFTVRDIDLSSSGSSKVRLNITGTINASMSGGSELLYKGAAVHGRIETSGGSEVMQIEN